MDLSHLTERAAVVLDDPARTREAVAAAFRAYAILASADPATGRTPDGDMASMSARTCLEQALIVDDAALRGVTP